MEKRIFKHIKFTNMIILMIGIMLNYGIIQMQNNNLGNWKTVYPFKRKTEAKTENFNVPSDIWRVKFSVMILDEWSERNNFDIYVYPVTGYDYVGMYDWDSSSTWFLYVEGRGEYYLKINTYNLWRWKAEVQVLE